MSRIIQWFNLMMMDTRNIVPTLVVGLRVELKVYLG